MRIWVDDGLRDATAPAIRASDRGFLLGDGLFETIRIADGTPRRLALHLERLDTGAALLGIPPPNRDSLAHAIGEVLAANLLEQGSLRITLTRGSGARGLDLPPEPSPTLVISCAAHGWVDRTVRVQVDRDYRRDERSPLSRVKALGYLPGILARQAARGAGGDDALHLNMEGRLCCATAGSLLVHQAGRWLTPPLEEGPLPGTARRVLIEEGVVQEAPIAPDDLGSINAGLIVNALGVSRILEIDGQVLPWGEEAVRAAETVSALLGT